MGWRSRSRPRTAKPCQHAGRRYSEIALSHHDVGERCLLAATLFWSRVRQDEVVEPQKRLEVDERCDWVEPRRLDYGARADHCSEARQVDRGLRAVEGKGLSPCAVATCEQRIRRPSVRCRTASHCSGGPHEWCARVSTPSSAPISRALGTPAVECLREDTVLDGSTCAVQDPL